MSCTNPKYVGRLVGLRYQIGCGDVFPADNAWKTFGSLTTKSFEISWDTTDTTTDSSVGNIREVIATWQNFSISGDGLSNVGGEIGNNLMELERHFVNPVATNGQPVLWLQIVFPGELTYTAYMLVESFSKSASNDESVSFSFSATATSSDFGIVQEPTIDPSKPAPTSVEAIPATLTLTVGDSYEVDAIVLPADAIQTVRWSSSADAVAVVNQFTGTIDAKATGTATITATAKAAPSVTDTIALTVIPVLQSISGTAVAVDVGDSATISLTFAPASADNRVKYESLNTAIATVDAAGSVTGVAAGTTQIRVTSLKRPSVSTLVNVTVSA